MSDNQEVTRWALLIGVDLYRAKTGERWEKKTLSSAVNDVEALSSYLRRWLSPVCITTLTASAASDPKNNRPTESDETSWPTKENIDKAFDDIAKKAKRDHHVYIHFSGHGTRVQQALALVLYKHTYPYSDYYMGHTFRDWLLALEEKGLIITVTLDCCESGSVQRSGISGSNPGVRFIDYDSQVAAASFAATPPSPPLRNNLRGATVSSREWRVNPTSYNIFTACEEDEIADEIPWNGVKRGAFSLILGMVLDYGAKSATTTGLKLAQRLQKPRTDEFWERIRFAEFQWEEHTSGPFIFSLTLADTDRTEILDASKVPVAHAPVLEASAPGAAEQMLKILQHLVSYKYFKTIESVPLPPSQQEARDVRHKIKLLASAKQLGNDDTRPDFDFCTSIRMMTQKI